MQPKTRIEAAVCGQNMSVTAGVQLRERHLFSKPWAEGVWRCVQSQTVDSYCNRAATHPCTSAVNGSDNYSYYYVCNVRVIYILSV